MEDIADLQLSIVNSKSNFFRLGGDSLAAMRIVNVAREQGLRLTVAAIFKNPTLESLSLSVTAIEDEEIFQDVTPFELIDSTSETLKELAEECSVPVEAIEDAYPCVGSFIYQTFKESRVYGHNLR